jgi:phosphatidylserine/phosphatidylglycerophosphate/cardiolipin synthase-like enzyme
VADRKLGELGRPDLETLAAALDSGRLAPPFTATSLRDRVPAAAVDSVARSLDELHRSGMTPAHLAVVLRFMAEERAAAQASTDRVQLVWSGPEVEGSASRDTAVVVQELFRQAKRSVLVASYALDRGEKARSLFRPLAERMDAQPALDVSLYVNLHRRYEDVREDAVLVRELARAFRDDLWPGERLPSVWYDPRSLQRGGGTRACLHAKCVVVDGERAFITSANFTDAAHARNLEAGVLLTDERVARALTAQFATLATSGLLAPLRLT